MLVRGQEQSVFELRGRKEGRKGGVRITEGGWAMMEVEGGVRERSKVKGLKGKRNERN